MCKSLMRAIGVTCLVGVAGLSTEALGASTVSLRAVAKNGGPITPTNTLSIAPNDTITADIFFFSWQSPAYDGGSALVKTYQATVLGAQGAASNSATEHNRYVLPVGWDAPLERDSCPCENPTFPVCNPAYGCVGNAFNADAGASINGTRTDFIFFGFANVNSPAVADLNFKWGGTINGADAQIASRCQGGTNNGFGCNVAGDCPGGSCNANFLHYAGTLNLKAGSGACGSYTFTFANDVALTFLGNADPFPFTAVPSIIQGLTLNTGVSCPAQPTGACCDETNPSTPVCTPNLTEAQCETTATRRWGGANSTCNDIQPACAVAANQITTVEPPHCLIDARRPFPPGLPAQRQGIQQMILTFQNNRTAGEDAANDFTIAQVPSTTPPFPPTMSFVAGPAANQVTLNFNVPIQHNRWTCVTHTASGGRRCIGYLPADVSSDRTANPPDIIRIIDNLNGTVNPPLMLHQCDIDRGGTCQPPDIITVIDLLNGANGWPIQNGRTLEACPSMNP